MSRLEDVRKLRQEGFKSANKLIDPKDGLGCSILAIYTELMAMNETLAMMYDEGKKSVYPNKKDYQKEKKHE